MCMYTVDIYCVQLATLLIGNWPISQDVNVYVDIHCVQLSTILIGNWSIPQGVN